MTTEAVYKTVVDIHSRVCPKCVVCSFGNGLNLEFDAAGNGSVTTVKGEYYDQPK